MYPWMIYLMRSSQRVDYYYSHMLGVTELVYTFFNSKHDQLLLLSDAAIIISNACMSRVLISDVTIEYSNNNILYQERDGKKCSCKQQTHIKITNMHYECYELNTIIWLQSGISGYATMVQWDYRQWKKLSMPQK